MINKVFIHENAIVETEDIGDNTKIWSFSHVSKGVKIGKNCTIGECVFIGNDVIIGDNCRIQNGSLIYSGVEIGNDVLIGPSVITTNDIFPTLHDLPENFKTEDWIHRFRKTYIQDGVAIGANSTIVCGVTLGEKCLIGAGSVVTKDIETGSIAYGNPCRVKRKYSDSKSALIEGSKKSNVKEYKGGTTANIPLPGPVKR